MLDIDKQVLLSALRAVEKLHFQNVALETLLEFYKIPNWKAQRDKLAADKKIQPELRAGFHALYARASARNLIYRWLRRSYCHSTQRQTQLD